MRLLYLAVTFINTGSNISKAYFLIERQGPLYYRLDILCRPVGQPHDREHGVHSGCCREEAAIADEETLDAMNFRVLTGYRGFGIGSHAAGSHLVGCEHHEAVYPHAMPLQLAIKLTELLLVYRSTGLPL